MATQSHILRGTGVAEFYGAGETIFKEGDSAREMYVVLEGCVEVRRGNEIIALIGPGEIFGEMALIDSGTRSATARALTHSAITPIDARRFEFLVSHTPQFALKVMRVLVQRLRITTAAHS
jgi:CRP/FNR family transcriptional regulator, cyclic AMP receptor protein